MLVVSNSSPLIALARLSHLDLLQSLYSEIQIPQAVYQEVVQAGKGREGSAAVDSASWISVQTVQDAIALETQAQSTKPEANTSPKAEEI